jgi:hypothetical protein
VVHALLARYVHGRRGEVMAAELGVTESRISQIQKESIRRLREVLAKPLSQAARPWDSSLSIQTYKHTIPAGDCSTRS